MSSSTEEIVEITGLSSEGAGVGRLEEGRVVFVDGAVPGDEVRLRDVELRARFGRAEIGELVRPSAARTEPRCPHFGACGGCQWQHVRYADQLEAKRKIVFDALSRIGGLDGFERPPITPSPDAYAYRARARWVETGRGPGFRSRRSRTIHAVDDCPVLLPPAAEALRERAREGMSASSDAARSRRPQEWIVTAAPEGETVLARAGAKVPRGGAHPSVEIEVLGESLRVSASSFVQGNALLWDALAAAVRDACLSGVDPEGGVRFLELYCGIGFFTLPLLRSGLRGTAIESDSSALADLRFNLRRAGLVDRVEVVSGSVERRGDLADRMSGAEVVLVDPPRAGLHARVREGLGRRGPNRIVYLSCNPATLARDLGELVDVGYAVESCRLFDLFPQTPHVETLVALTRA